VDTMDSYLNLILTVVKGSANIACNLWRHALAITIW
jgi:hypothetical protein